MPSNIRREASAGLPAQQAFALHCCILRQPATNSMGGTQAGTHGHTAGLQTATQQLEQMGTALSPRATPPPLLPRAMLLTPAQHLVRLGSMTTGLHTLLGCTQLSEAMASSSLAAPAVRLALREVLLPTSGVVQNLRMTACRHQLHHPMGCCPAPQDWNPGSCVQCHYALVVSVLEAGSTAATAFFCRQAAQLQLTWNGRSACRRGLLAG